MERHTISVGEQKDLRGLISRKANFIGRVGLYESVTDISLLVVYGGAIVLSKANDTKCFILSRLIDVMAYCCFYFLSVTLTGIELGSISV